MVKKVVSGGQTGADQGGLEAALRLGLERGGQMPKGYLTEAGPDPEVAAKHNLTESASEKYPPRTAHNVKDSDGTVIFGNPNSRGSRLTADLCEAMSKPHFQVPYPSYFTLQDRKYFQIWVTRHNIEVLNVAGNRESKNPGIHDFVVEFLIAALRG